MWLCCGKFKRISAEKHDVRARAKVQEKVSEALKKRQKENLDNGMSKLNLARILLRFSSMRSVLTDITKEFDSIDIDKSGSIDRDELLQAMHKLHIRISDEDVVALFSLADFYHQSKLTLKQFLVCLALVHLLGGMPANETEERSFCGPEPSDASPGVVQTHREVATRLKSAIDLIVAAYLIFDKECKGYINQATVTKELGDEDGGGSIGPERWNELDWDSSGNISFEEFVYAFEKWVDLDPGDDGMQTVRVMSRQHSEEDPASENGKSQKSH